MTLLDAQALLPLIVLAAGSAILLLVISFFRNYTGTFVLNLLIHAGALAALVPASATASRTVAPLFIVDGFGLFFQGMILLASLVVSSFAFDYFRKFHDSSEEFFVLLLLATLGAATLPVCNHFIAFFLGLELLTVPLYAIVAYTLTRESSLEAGVKYLLLAAASSAFLLFGMALLYVETGQMEFPLVAVAMQAIRGLMGFGVILAGLAFILVGIGFKLSLVPFHWWTPDVYQGAPAPVAAYLATVSKAAVVAVALRLAGDLELASYPAAFSALGAIIFLSILFGNLLALSQDNLKRLLAYSSIAHMGYLAIAFLAAPQAGVEAGTLYMVGYLFTSLGTFGIICALSSSESERERLEDFRGLYGSHPILSGLLTLFMLSLAGIPLTAGFIGKFMIVTAGAQNFQALLPLLITLAAGSAIGLFYYLRVIWVLFQKQDAPARTVTFQLTFAGLVGVALAILLVGVYPSPVIELMNQLAFGAGF